jgi:hypothetical protein
MSRNMPARWRAITGASSGVAGRIRTGAVEDDVAAVT